MPPSYYDRYGRGPRRGPGREESQVLTAAQIAKIEAAFEELNKKAAHWEAQAKQWQTTAAQSQEIAGEWQGRAKELERALAEAQTAADEARRHCAELQETAGSAQESFAAWEARAAEYASEAELAEQRVNELEQALKEVEEGHGDEAQRLKEIESDFLESKGRLERRFAIQAESERRGVLRDLLPVLDNLDLALAHLTDESQDAQNLRQGVELTRQSFLKMLAGHGVRAIDPLGEEFDPEIHEAVGSVAVPGRPPGTVVNVEQKGYLVDDDLLRPARVLVTPL